MFYTQVLMGYRMYAYHPNVDNRVPISKSEILKENALKFWTSHEKLLNFESSQPFNLLVEVDCKSMGAYVFLNL